MSGVMRLLEEWEARGYGAPDGTICSMCVLDEALATTVRLEGDDRTCDQCGERPNAPHATVDLERVVQIVAEGLLLEYDDPINESHWESAEGGYTVPHLDKYDLLRHFEVVATEDILDQIADAICGELWCQRHPYEATPAQALQWGWQRFAEHVKQEHRESATVVPDDDLLGGGEISIAHVPDAVAAAIEDSDSFVTLEAGTHWWRARVHPSEESYSTASEIGTPPDAYARANRMTPNGVGAFYGASSLDGARAEVAGYADPDQAASAGRFTQLTDLRLVDLRDFPPVPSLFDENNRHRRAARQFMHDFITNVTQVADPADEEHLQYVPTQVIAEHLRTSLGIDGICWRSSKNRDVIAGVLFLPNAAMVDSGSSTASGRLQLDPSTLRRFEAPLTASVATP